VEEVQRLIHTARNYMHHRFRATSTSVPSSIQQQQLCQNRHAKCALWALDGWCETHPVWMSRDCGPICGSCPAPSTTTIEGRCPMDPNAPNAWAPGDLNRLFTKLSTTEPYLSLYKPQILSSPDTTGGPWVLTMENFVTRNEAERFIELGHEMGFQKSAGMLYVFGTAVFLLLCFISLVLLGRQCLLSADEVWIKLARPSHFSLLFGSLFPP
jgi:prolyl 4-hydroxylase